MNANNYCFFNTNNNSCICTPELVVNVRKDLFWSDVVGTKSTGEVVAVMEFWNSDQFDLGYWGTMLVQAAHHYVSCPRQLCCCQKLPFFLLGYQQTSKVVAFDVGSRLNQEILLVKSLSLAKCHQGAALLGRLGILHSIESIDLAHIYHGICKPEVISMLDRPPVNGQRVVVGLHRQTRPSRITKSLRSIGIDVCIPIFSIQRCLPSPGLSW